LLEGLERAGFSLDPKLDLLADELQDREDE